MLQLSGKWLALVLALIALAVGPALAQETTAGIQGTVRDATGGTVAGATVEVSGPTLIGIRKVTTDDAGAYRIAALPPGVYTMIVTAKGFRTSRSGGLGVRAERRGRWTGQMTRPDAAQMPRPHFSVPPPEFAGRILAR